MMQADINILVTGASGFIGHYLVQRLFIEAEKQEHTTSIVSLDVEDRNPEYTYLPERNDGRVTHTWVKHDLADKEATADLLCRLQPNVIYHLAAYFGGMTILESSALEICRRNTEINQSMAYAIDKLCSRIGSIRGSVRLFFSSSQCVYRNQAKWESELYEHEMWNGRASNLYGEEKRLAEWTFQTLAQRHGNVECVIGRFGNCYGPESQWDSPQAKAPAALCNKVVRARNHTDIEIYGEGDAVRSYIYIDDLINGILAVCPPVGHVYSGHEFNLSSDEYVTVRHLAETIIRISGKSLWVRSVPGPVGNEGRFVSSAKAAGYTRWRCNVPLRNGLIRLYEWVREMYDKKDESGAHAQNQGTAVHAAHCPQDGA